ncbi:MAG: DNA (cytosine-5-)-methyltransferase [Lactobacillus sp.]|nr:DNA (cytosine-5-)-methyltransferase [Lactobacillus sp.]
MKALELFAGIGGIALAEQMAGIEVVGLSEIEDYPVKVLQKNFPNVPILRDVKKINKESLREVGIDADTINIVSGGFPCQPFSTAGKRRGREDDRDLWPEMFRIIQEIRPNWVVGENVANFANMELDRTLSNLESEGYQTRTFVLPATAVGAPHQRLRTFIVANSNGRRWPGLEKSKSKRCNWKHTESLISKKRQKKSWSEAVHILSAGARILSGSSSRLRRNDYGISKGMDRLKCVGNAVMPEQILPIFQAIVAIEGESKNQLKRDAKK